MDDDQSEVAELREIVTELLKGFKGLRAEIRALRTSNEELCVELVEVRKALNKEAPYDEDETAEKKEQAEAEAVEVEMAEATTQEGGQAIASEQPESDAPVS